MSIPGTLLGSAHWDALVPFEPRHWAELRERCASAAATRKVVDDALAVALYMSRVTRTVFVAGRVECVIGLWLAPNEGAPWVMAPHPDAERFARAIELCRPFIEECRALRPLLLVERECFDEQTRIWLAGLGFERVAGAMETWRFEGTRGPAVPAERELRVRSAEIVQFEMQHWIALRERLHEDHRERMEGVAPIDETFMRALRASVLVRTAVIDGVPECIMGCGLLPDAGLPWLMKTDVAMTKFWRVIRQSRPFIAECLQLRPMLWADVPEDDGLVQRWLQWLGFRRVSARRWEVDANHGH